MLPAADYRDRKVKPDNAAEFDSLIATASVHTMPFTESNPDAYMAAGEHVLSLVDKMIAIWDGGPPGGHGGTADVVEAARGRGLAVTVVWPERCRGQRRLAGQPAPARYRDHGEADRAGAGVEAKTRKGRMSCLTSLPFPSLWCPRQDSNLRHLPPEGWAEAGWCVALTCGFSRSRGGCD
ncbi:hypothetical protein [Amycolatopsis sp. MtRt-6]|uniref:hypothetical protein n=1 Tax=Amycolatopsis sp. MtRt-6 TaxID=2792782 RepID=UPI001F5E2772|nr:hypothetical protein [Amycolatopsis sp. MtRt-6]